MPPSTSRQVQLPGATVIAFYTDADGQFSNPKVGYNSTRFDETCSKFLINETFRSKSSSINHNSNQDLSIEKDLMENLKLKNNHELGNNVLNGKELPIQLSKQDVQFIISELEVTAKVAEKALRRSHGNLETALLNLIQQ